MCLKSLRIIVLAIIASVTASISARRVNDEERPTLIRLEQTALSKSTTAADSVRHLYNLYDLVQREDSQRYSRPIYEISMRTGDYTTALDMLRNVAAKNVRNDSLIAECRELAKEIPASYDQMETMVFLDVNHYMAKLYKMSQTERTNLLPQLIDGYSDDPAEDIYDRTTKLYKLAMALAYSIGGDLYSDSMDRLRVLLEHLPGSNGSLMSMYNTQAAIGYSLNREYQKAAAADRQQLERIDSLRMVHAVKRPYRDYTDNLYICYRRLLGNFPSLTKQEINAFHDTITHLAAINENVRRDLEANGRATAYYLYAVGQYPQAMSLLKNIVDNPRNEMYRRKLLRMLMRSAERTGDKATLLTATTAYNKMLEELVNEQSQEKVRDLQVMFDINDIKDRRIAELTADNEELKSQTHSRLTMLGVALGIAFGVIAVLVAWIAVRRRRNNK